MRKVKVITSSSPVRFEKQIQEFFDTHTTEAYLINFTTTYITADNHVEYTALIEYEETEKDEVTD